MADRQIILLVTLEKRTLNQEHRYEDRFLSADEFQWQSQNRTKQDSMHGRLIRNHREKQIGVHLFVRKHKVLDGRGAPFVYCGTVDFVKWNGDAPITVHWKLQEPVPEPLQRTLDVSPSAG